MSQIFSASERCEIQRHKYFMSLESGFDVGLDAATKDWVANHKAAWRQQRQIQMLAMQREEINRHKWLESEKAAHDLGIDAKFDWIRKYAAQWREWYDREFEENEA